MSSSSFQDADDLGGPPGHQAIANVDGSGNGNGSGIRAWDYGEDDFEDFPENLNLDELFGDDEDDEVNKSMEELFGRDNDDDGANNANNEDNNSIVVNNNNLADADDDDNIAPGVLSESPDPAMSVVDSNIDNNNSVEVDIPLMQASMHMPDDRLSSFVNPGEGQSEILPRSAIGPGLGTSAMGTAVPDNGMSVGGYTAHPATDNSAVEISGPFNPQEPIMDNSATGYSLNGNNVIDNTVTSTTFNNDGSTIVSLWEGNPSIDNSATAYSLIGNNVINNTAILYNNYDSMNNNGVAPTNQFDVTAYLSNDASVMGNPALAASYQFNDNPAPVYNDQLNYNPVPAYNDQYNYNQAPANNDQFNYVDMFQYQVAQQQQMVAYAPPAHPDPAAIPLENNYNGFDAQLQQFDAWYQQHQIEEQQRHAAELAAAFPPQFDPANAPAPAPAPAPIPAPLSTATNPAVSFGLPSMGPAPAPFVFPQPIDAPNYPHPIGNAVAPGNNNNNVNNNINPNPNNPVPQPLPRAFEDPNRPRPPSSPTKSSPSANSPPRSS
ncbi:hypothetical protein B0T20DRAFT_498513 [Sordaria brevicollis]|uniref:Uncharacterized protein n=1 Tax=Sordaria brevicollis TaxID=83679 RepID=A0AAE0PF14_SORBR|nr:hypothetical protein B0T20DRAFT_498513 [Sordaria brevicollis]